MHEAIRKAEGAPGQSLLCIRPKRRENAKGQELNPHYEVTLNGVVLFGPAKQLQDAVDFFSRVRVALKLEVRR